MKHLKKFNESIDQEDIEEILDMWKEVAEENNMTKVDTYGDFYDCGRLYYIPEKQTLIRDTFEIHIRYGGIGRSDRISVDKFISELIGFTKRLTGIGYEVYLLGINIRLLLEEDNLADNSLLSDSIEGRMLSNDKIVIRIENITGRWVGSKWVEN